MGWKTPHARTGSATARRTAVVAALVLAGAALVPAATVGGTARRAQVAFRLDHFLCYSIRLSGAFRPRSVVLLDQFRPARKTQVLAPELLCNPTSKNGGRIVNRRGHLLCYTTRSPQTFRSRRVTVRNQFGTARLAVARPAGLCLPTGKSRDPTLKPPPPGRLDHFECYPVKPLTTPRLPSRVGLRDQFHAGKYAIRRPLRLCNPVGKNKSRVLNARDHLVCYSVAPLQPTRPRGVHVVNQFGRLALTAVTPRVLCLPSLKRELPRLPDLTVTIDQASLSVSCPGGGGTCVTTFIFTVTNAGAGSAGAFDASADADPAGVGPKVVSFPGLAAGASATRTVSFGPAGNCFDPECTVSVTVDSGNVVAESNESNNTDTFTALG